MKIIIIFIVLVLCIIMYCFKTTSSYTIINDKPKGENIICFGDSLTLGVGASNNMSYPSQLSKKINRKIINLGKSGDTTATALSRIDEVLNNNPKIVLITIGGNDLKNGVNKDIVFLNLEKIISKIQDKGALVIIGGIDIPLKGRGFASAYKELARKKGAILIPNILKNIYENSSLMSDLIHQNSKGYSVMTEHFYNAIKDYLGIAKK